MLRRNDHSASQRTNGFAERRRRSNWSSSKLRRNSTLGSSFRSASTRQTSREARRLPAWKATCPATMAATPPSTCTSTSMYRPK